jgi:hypothetical protein
MKSKMFLIINCLILFCGFVNLIAQTIQGIITDPLTTKGIPNLVISIGDCTTVTDSKGYYSITLSNQTDVEYIENAEQKTIRKFELHNNYPNPFNSETIINYELPKDCYVEITIYNSLAQEIETLVNSQQNAGHHQIGWDGLDTSGNQASSGLYFIRMKSEAIHMTKKIVLLR